MSRKNWLVLILMLLAGGDIFAYSLRGTDIHQLGRDLAAMKATTQYMQLLLSIDVHAPNKLRANVQVQNLAEFFKTFNIQEGDGMWKAPADRVNIW